MKRIALIGHRGVGKTSLLKRVARDLETPSYDLGEMIEKRAGRSISEIFQKDGETAFRRLELEALNDVPAGPAIVAIGAGFPVDQLSSDWHAIWVRRVTDETGRIFVDRPRLDTHLSALDEFKSRRQARDPRFAQRADAVLFLDEGAEDADDPAEKAYFKNEWKNLGGALTVMPEAFARNFEAWATTRVKWGFRWFELRDDLLTREQMESAVQILPDAKTLVSLRDRAREAHSLSLQRPFDWPVERGTPKSTATFLSLHERTSTLASAFELLSEAAKQVRTFVPFKLKAALPVSTFDELFEGHRWQLQDPAHRIFLPMSSDGRWSWYRLLRHQQYALNFVRESGGSASDQPTLLQWARFVPSKQFAAVLGDPVKHSRTPLEHAEFFRARNKNVFAIQMNEQEWPAVNELIKLGLTEAAVTAPLKQKAYEFVNAATDLLAINTVNFTKRVGTNTDLVGLEKAVSHMTLPSSAAVWGGGGTLKVVSKVFPQAQLVSVRTRLTRDGAKPQNPDLVIWAASLKPGQNDPPKEWQPKVVLDLNYSEASPARDYALKTGAKYISGLAMFKEQAQAQREFWQSVEGSR